MPKMTKYASAAVAATIAPAFDASNRYVRMPTIRATNAPSTIGTWYVGVCESSRHDWPSPVPDFARVASMVLSPPERHPPVPGHSRIGTIFEPRVPRDKHDVAPPLTIGFRHPRGGPTPSSWVLKGMAVCTLSYERRQLFSPRPVPDRARLAIQSSEGPRAGGLRLDPATMASPPRADEAVSASEAGSPRRKPHGLFRPRTEGTA